MVIFDHVDEYVIRDVGEMLSDVRYEGVQMAQRVMSVLNSGGIVTLDCCHKIGREYKGMFHLVQLKSSMFTVVCDSCIEFAVMGENIRGELPSKVICGQA